VKIPRIANNSAATEAREKNKHRFGVLGNLGEKHLIFLIVNKIRKP
jgi:hypothetical protein